MLPAGADGVLSVPGGGDLGDWTLMGDEEWQPSVTHLRNASCMRRRPVNGLRYVLLPESHKARRRQAAAAAHTGIDDPDPEPKDQWKQEGHSDPIHS